MPHGRRLDSIGEISIPRAVASRSCLKVDVFTQCVKVYAGWFATHASHKNRLTSSTARAVFLL